MPVRPKKSEQGRHQYEYEELLKHIRKYIDESFGGVANFLGSEEFVKCDFIDTPKERAKMFTYLSLPIEGKKARVKSFPVLQRLFEHLLGVKIESKIKVIREQKLFTDRVL